MKESRRNKALCADLLNIITTTSMADNVGVLPVTPDGTDFQAHYDPDWNVQRKQISSSIWRTHQITPCP
jgi:hypothetical protein